MASRMTVNAVATYWEPTEPVSPASCAGSLATPHLGCLSKLDAFRRCSPNHQKGAGNGTQCSGGQRLLTSKPKVNYRDLRTERCIDPPGLFKTSLVYHCSPFKANRCLQD